jgi:hypothetical protein
MTEIISSLTQVMFFICCIIIIINIHWVVAGSSGFYVLKFSIFYYSEIPKLFVQSIDCVN